MRHPFKNMSRQEKVMLLFIILFIAAIISRWEYISTQVTGAFKDRYVPRKSQPATEQPATDADTISF